MNWPYSTDSNCNKSNSCDCCIEPRIKFAVLGSAAVIRACWNLCAFFSPIKFKSLLFFHLKVSSKFKWWHQKIDQWLYNGWPAGAFIDSTMSNEWRTATIPLSRRFGRGAYALPRLVPHRLSILMVRGHNIEYAILCTCGRLQFNHHRADCCRNQTICTSQQRSNDHKNSISKRHSFRVEMWTNSFWILTGSWHSSWIDGQRMRRCLHIIVGRA